MERKNFMKLLNKGVTVLYSFSQYKLIELLVFIGQLLLKKVKNLDKIIPRLCFHWMMKLSGELNKILNVI